ncbi:MAG: hypothetical protein IJ480_01600 [Clostridia bacterium]|nr:hypothetical protein [Clostridia bacterium]
MTEKRFVSIFRTLTRCIFTVLTAETAWLLSMTMELERTSACFLPFYYQLPMCLETLAAGVLLYMILGAASALILREYGT